MYQESDTGKCDNMRKDTVETPAMASVPLLTPYTFLLLFYNAPTRTVTPHFPTI